MCELEAGPSPPPRTNRVGDTTMTVKDHHKPQNYAVIQAWGEFLGQVPSI